MIPNPIRKVLSSMRARRVRCLLMGGQACVFYGAAEFSRDTDLAILANAANLARLQAALDDLCAEVIAVPPFELRYLKKGHAVHFRCRHPEAPGLRVDVMSRMRNVDPFPNLWRRRATIEMPGGELCDILSLPDLVQAKKTQRDKDWPMIRRLIEAHYFQNQSRPNAFQIRFWLRELRTPELLIEVAQERRRVCARLVRQRPLLAAALQGDSESIERQLAEEEAAERNRDRIYWRPLRAELEKLRHAK
ncbi:MAG: hypothetical protein NTX50_14685 [Candidatus Sumerlaeota bacterium]|nr:hypothetical protein [Candidatus Sumerlaeota bacterium]